MIRILKTFTATWSNYGCKPKTRTFNAGETYAVQASRPEGVEIDGFFLFAQDVRQYCERT